MRYLIKYFTMIFIITNACWAFSNEDLTLDFQNVSLSQVLHFIAKVMKVNIIINPSVRTVISVHLKGVSPTKTFDMLLTSYDLMKVPLGNTWLIVPRKEWRQHIQEELRMKETMDTVAPLVTRIWQIHYAKAEDIAHLLQDNSNSLLSHRGHVRIDPRTNILCVQDTEKSLQAVQQLIFRTDVPVQQVLIKTHLASIDNDYERHLGLNFSVNAASEQGLLIAKLSEGLDVKLIAMENSGHGELLSSPKLFTANQQTATIEAGEEIPYQEESLSGGTSVAFKKAVLSLKVTPQVLPNKKILLQIQVNQDKPSKSLVQGVPAIITRQIITNVLVKDGETVVLGGIYESNNQQNKQSIPFLGTIPVLGLLFQQRDVISNKRKLLIFVTPKIIPQDQ